VRCTIIIRNVDQRLVKRGVTSVTYQVLDIILVLVLVASAAAAIATKAEDWKGNICTVRICCVTEGLVDITVRVVVEIRIGAVQPEAGEQADQEKRCDQCTREQVPR